MELLLVLVGLVALDWAAWRWGADSRGTAKGHFGAGGLLPQWPDSEPGDPPAPRDDRRGRLQPSAHVSAAPA